VGEEEVNIERENSESNQIKSKMLLDVESSVDCLRIECDNKKEKKEKQKGGF